MTNEIVDLINSIYRDAKSLEGISLKEEPLRFDVAAPIITEWVNLPREKLSSINDKRDPHKFLQSLVSVADVQIPYDRKSTKQIVDAGISFVSVLFAREGNDGPAIMIRAYVPSKEKYLNFERLTTVLSKTYCPSQGINWENLCEDIRTLDIKDEFYLIVKEFQKAVNEVKNREELEKKVHKTYIRYV